MNAVAIRKNVALLAGVFFPLLLILFIWGTQKIAEVSIPAPIYPLVFCDHDGYWNGDIIDVRVENGHIAASSKISEPKNVTTGANDLILVFVNAATGERKTARLVAPAVASPGSVVDIPIPEPFASLKIHEGDLSPDGYHVEDTSENGAGSIFRDMFGGQNLGKIIISKNGRNMAIRTETTYWKPIKILGWAEP